MWRIVAGAAATSLVALNGAVTADEALRLAGLLAGGAAAGALPGWWLSRRLGRARPESSRYAPRLRRRPTALSPSPEALSRWPIVQAFAWNRPENARLVLAAAVLSVPGGTGAIGGVSILIMWFLASYLFAVLRAVPHVARSAAEWLRSTPIGFRAFAWPLAWRALAHQCCGTVIAAVVLVLMGSPPISALYAGALWLTLVMLTAAIALADCYRGRSPPVKLALAVTTTLLAETRGYGFGISFAFLVCAWHLRRGATHARA